MSLTAFALVNAFSQERISAEQFVDAYMEIWRFERDSGILKGDEAKLNECLSSVFCLADLFNSDSDRAEYELDEVALRAQVSALINTMGFKA